MEQLRSLTSAEEMVMRVIFEHEEDLGLMEIRDECNRRYEKEWAPQTVSTFLHRLVEKEYVTLYRQGRVFYYHRMVDEKDYLKRKTSEFVSFWFHNNVDEMLQALMTERALSSRELNRTREIMLQAQR